MDDFAEMDVDFGMNDMFGELPNMMVRIIIINYNPKFLNYPKFT